MTIFRSVITRNSPSSIYAFGAAFVLQLGFLVLAGVSLAAGPVFWDWPDGRSFSELELDGVALDLGSGLIRGLDSRQIGPSGPEVFWNLAADGKGGVYLGSGHGGEIYHLDRQGETRLLASLDGPEVFSILPLDEGGLLAGCGPEGQLFRIDEKGEATLLGKVAGGYVWAMARRPGTQEVWLAAGSPAAVYRLDRLETLEEVQTLGAQNCLALAFDTDGDLLLGTQGPGLVYRLDPRQPKKLEVVFEAPQDEVRQFISGPEGLLYFLALNSDEDDGGSDASGSIGKNGDLPGSLMSLFEVSKESTLDKSALFRLETDGGVTPYWASDLDLMIGAWSSTWGWLAGGALDADAGLSNLHRLVAPAGHHPVASWAGGDLIDLLVVAADGGPDRVLVAQAHPGSVWEVGRFDDQTAVALSPPLDGRQPVVWGRLRWNGDTKGGLHWSVRGGNRAEPDGSWSKWTDSWTETDRPLKLDPCRFLQWRVEFPQDRSGAQSGPRVSGVSVSAWQANTRPVVRDLVLEKISDLSIGGMMNGSDNVTQTFQSGLKAEFSRNSRQDRRAEGSRAAVTRPVRVFTWLGQDPNGDRLVYRLEYVRQGDQAWRGIIDHTEETIGSWDTSQVPDGHYRVRLTASDEADNPKHLALSATTETEPILVDNTPPLINGFTLDRTAIGFRVGLEAKDGSSSLAGAVVQLPDGSRQRLDPVDRICDSRQEKFAAEIEWPQIGKPTSGPLWQVRVEIRDLAGNLAIAEGEVEAER